MTQFHTSFDPNMRFALQIDSSVRAVLLVAINHKHRDSTVHIYTALDRHFLRYDKPNLIWQSGVTSSSYVTMTTGQGGFALLLWDSLRHKLYAEVLDY